MIEQLKDIKPFIINSNIFYIKYIILLLVLVIGIVFILYIFRKKKVKVNLQEHYLEELKSLNWDNAKKTSYKIKLIGNKLIFTEKSSQLYEDLLDNLKLYKYKKYVPIASNKTIIKYNLLIEILENEQF